MGILNVTPDSFSGDGLLIDLPSTNKISNGQGLTLKNILRRAKMFIHDGADILDVGGESSRPGAKPVSEKEEIERVIPVIRLLSRKINRPVSVDTHKPAVAELALKSGASIVNTIRGINPDTRLLKAVARHKAAIVLMHMRGNPATMQKKIHYHDLMKEIVRELTISIEKCLETGIKSDRIIIDPGIGFGKTVYHNLEILRRLDILKKLNQPILVGTSRKSFIGNVLNQGDPARRIMGTAATVSAAILNGAHIVRVHDVREMYAVAKITDAILNHQSYQK